MHVLEWLVASYDMKINNIGYETGLEDELIEMHVGLKANVLFKSKNVSDYWSSINTADKYPKTRAAAELFLLALPTVCMV